MGVLPLQTWIEYREDKTKMKKAKLLSCFLVLVIMVSAMPVSVFAISSANTAANASNPSDGLEKVFTENVSVAGCNVSVAINDDTCVGYEVWVDGVYRFTEGQGTTPPDGYCAFYVTEGTHTLEIRKNGCSASKTYTFLCGISYTWVSMPDYWCECGGGNCDNPPTVNFNKTKYYEGDTVRAIVSAPYFHDYNYEYTIKDCSGVVRDSGYINSSSYSIYYTIPDGSVSSCCYWTICFSWYESGDLGNYIPPGENPTASSYQCTKCYSFYVCPDTCEVYLIIDDDTCVGYEVWVDGVYQFTEGQGTIPDGYCAFYVTEGTHTLEIRKNGCSASKTYNFLCGIRYTWVSMPDYWCVCNIDYKLDEYGVIQQKYDEESAVNKASPTAMVYEPYIDLIPYNEASKGATLNDLSVGITDGEVTVYSPTESATLSPDRSELTWYNPVVSDEYNAELMYEASFAHPIEVTATITVSGSEVYARVKNVANCDIYNVVVLNHSDYGWHYGTIDSLAENEEKTLTLSEGMTLEDVKSAFYDYFIRALDDSGLDPTDHRNGWLNAWICAWFDQIPSADPPLPKYPSSIIYRIPQSLYEQYFSCSVSPEPDKGMIRVGLVHLYDIPAEIGKPDLIIQDISWSPSSPDQGDTITFSMTIKNDGDGNADSSSTVKYYIDGINVDFDPVPALSAGSISIQTFTWTDEEICGDVQVKAVADANNDVDEGSNEWNNEKIKSLTVGCKLMEGDVTLDGLVTITDARFIAQYKAGLISLNANQLQCADTTDDGVVSMVDYMHILQWKVDSDGTIGILYKPLWESPADDGMRKPVA